jgi:hypothetical protein
MVAVTLLTDIIRLAAVLRPEEATSASISSGKSILYDVHNSG